MAVGAIGAIGLITTLVGTGLSVFGQFQAAKAAKKAEKQRKLQARLEAQRNRREIARRSVVARATALANAANQGAQFSSPALGGQSSVTSQGARQTVGTNQNERIGVNISNFNQKITQGNTLAGLGSGISSFGSSISNNIGTISSLG
jgi:hypothetical protein